MPKPHSIKQEAYKIVFWQLAIVVALALVFFLLQGIKNGFSALLGGLAYAGPNLFFVWYVFAHEGARSAKKFLVAFLTGELLKLIFSGVIFVLAVKYLPVHVISMMIGFVGAIVAFWVVSFYIISHDTEVLL